MLNRVFNEKIETNKTFRQVMKNTTVLSFVSAAVAFGFVTDVSAQLTGFEVIAGNVDDPVESTDTDGDGTLTTINQNDDLAIIQWDTFNIDAADSVQFTLPNGDAISLNRILDSLPSDIRGRLLSNGNVWLVNGNGITFHSTSQVDVNGLIATSADIDDANFLAGDYTFDVAGAADAAIVNDGAITFGDAGLVGLIGPRVSNAGSIIGQLGTVTLAGEETFTVDIMGGGLFEFTFPGDPLAADGTPRVDHTGLIQNDGGLIFVTARAADQMLEEVIHMGGVTIANSVSASDGQIIIAGGDGLVRVDGSLTASGDDAGENGGAVSITSGGITFEAGSSIVTTGDNADGSVDIQATSSAVDLRSIATGTLSVNASGDITQSEALTTSGVTVLTTTDNIVLDDDGNDFGDLVTVTTAQNVTLNDANDLLVAGTVLGDLTADAGNDLVFDTTSIDGALTATAGNDISQAAADDTLVIAGTSTLSASNDISLGNDGNDFGDLVTVTTAQNVTLNDANDLLFAGTVLGDLTADAGNDLIFDTTSIDGALTATAGNDISQAAADDTLSVSGTSTLTTGNNITLGNDGNDFATVTVVTAQDVDLFDQNSVSLANSVIEGDLRLEAVESVTVSTTRVGRSTTGGTFIDADGNVLIIAQNQDVTISDLRASSLTIGGVSSANGVPTAVGDSVSLANVIANEILMAATGAVSLNGVLTSGSITVDAATDLSLTNTVTQNLLAGNISGTLSLNRYRQSEDLVLSAGDIRLAFIDVPSITLTATAGDISNVSDDAIDFAAAISDDGFTVSGPQGEGDTVVDASVDTRFSAFENFILVPGDSSLSALGDVFLVRGLNPDTGEFFHNDFQGNVSLTAGDSAALEDENGILLNVINVANDFAVRADSDATDAGDETITQVDGAAFSVGGNLSLFGTDAITLTNSTNSFNSVSVVQSLSGGDVNLLAADSYALRDSRIIGNLMIAVGNSDDLSIDDTSVSGNVDVGSVMNLTGRRIDINGTLSASPLANVSLTDLMVDGAVTLNADGKLELDRFILGETLTASAGGVVNLSNGSVASLVMLDAIEDVSLFNVSLDSDAVVSSLATLRLDSVIANNLDITAAADIEFGVVRVDGTLDASAGRDILTVAPDDSAGSFIVSGPNATTVGVDVFGAPRVLEQLAQGGSQNSSGADLNVSDLLVVVGAADLRANRNITLVRQDLDLSRHNDFQGTVNLEGLQIAVEDRNSLLLGAVNATNFAVRLNSDGQNGVAESLTQTTDGSISVTDEFTILTSGAVTVDNASNAFNRVSVVHESDGGNVALGDTDGFTLENSRIAGDLMIGSGVQHQEGGLELLDTVVDGNVSFTLGGALMGQRNQFTGDANLAVEGTTSFTDLIIDGTVDFLSGGDILLDRFFFGADATLLASLSGITLSAYNGQVNGALSIGAPDSNIQDIEIANVTVLGDALLNAVNDIHFGSAFFGSSLTANAGRNILTVDDFENVGEVTVEGPRAVVVGIEAPLSPRVTASLDAGDNAMITGVSMADQLVVSGEATFNAGDSITLVRQNATETGDLARHNDFRNIVNLRGSRVAIEDRNRLLLGTVAATNLAVRLNSDGTDGAIEELMQSGNGSIRVDEVFTILTSGGVNLNNVTNAFNRVSVVHESAGGDVVLRDGDGFVLENSRIAGSLSIGAEGTDQSGDVFVSDTSVTDDAMIVLSGNLSMQRANIGGSMSATSTAASIDLDDIVIGGATQLTSAEDIALERFLISSNASFVSGRDIVSRNGAITGQMSSMSGGNASFTNLSVSGTSDVAASGDVRLDGTTSDAINLEAGGDIALGAVRVVNNFSAVAGGNIETFIPAIQSDYTISGVRTVVVGLDLFNSPLDPRVQTLIGAGSDLDVSGVILENLFEVGGRSIFDAGGNIALTQQGGRNNLFGGPVSLLAGGDITLEEELGPRGAFNAFAAGASDTLVLLGLAAGGDITIRTSDNVVIAGRRTRVAEFDLASFGVSQAELNDLGLRLNDGSTLTIDTTANGLSMDGADIRTDRAIDGQIDPTVSAIDLANRRLNSALLANLSLSAGNSGDVIVRDFIGVNSPLGTITINSARNVLFGISALTGLDEESLAALSSDDFLISELDGNNFEADYLFASVVNIADVQGRVLFAIPDSARTMFDASGLYYGVNLSGGTDASGGFLTPFVYGDAISLDAFGLLGTTRRREAALLPIGPAASEFMFNGCVIGDTNNCTALTVPDAIAVAPQAFDDIFEIDEEENSQIFSVFGNDELWPVPSGFSNVGN